MRGPHATRCLLTPAVLASLAAYLEWVARETGRELEFESEELSRASESIVVHGSIESMTPTESLQAVLPGSGLDYQIENGSLRVARP